MSRQAMSRRRHVGTAVFAALTACLLGPACTPKDPSVNGPSADELQRKLATELPAFVRIAAFDVQVSENVGDKVEPVFKTRFSGAIRLDADTFLQGEVLEGAVLAVPHLRTGETRKFFGVAVSSLKAGAWHVTFQMDGNALQDIGKPKDMFSGGKFLVRGSAEESAFREELRRQREATQLEEEAEARAAGERDLRLQEEARRQADAYTELERSRLEAEAQATEQKQKQAHNRLLALAALAQSKGLAGQSNSRRDAWPMRVRLTAVDPATGKFAGAVEWPTLSSVHAIEGDVIQDQFVFTEVRRIKEGRAGLGCTYTLKATSDTALAGTYKCRQFLGESGQTTLSAQ